MIAAGQVTVGGAPAAKPARLVAPGEAIEVHGGGPRFVSRGGDKLDAALDRFAIDVRDRRAIDLGASTGGFVDCLLQRGAATVVAVDVGYGQLDAGLRTDPRVEVRERTNARSVTPADLGGVAEVVVADLSFISFTAVAPAAVTLCREGGDLVVLVKPQFEAGRRDAARGRGVIRDPAVWRQALDAVGAALADAGAAIMGVMVSPLRGPAGNVEFLVHARPGGQGERVDLDAVVADAAAGQGSRS